MKKFIKSERPELNIVYYWLHFILKKNISTYLFTPIEWKIKSFQMARTKVSALTMWICADKKKHSTRNKNARYQKLVECMVFLRREFLFILLLFCRSLHNYVADARESRPSVCAPATDSHLSIYQMAKWHQNTVIRLRFGARSDVRSRWDLKKKHTKFKNNIDWRALRRKPNHWNMNKAEKDWKFINRK